MECNTKFFLRVLAKDERRSGSAMTSLLRQAQEGEEISRLEGSLSRNVRRHLFPKFKKYVTIYKP